MKNYLNRNKTDLIKILIFVIFATGFVIAGGQVLFAEERTTSLEECISIAERNNSDIKIQTQKVVEAKNKYYQQIGFLLPQIDTNIWYNYYKHLQQTQKELAGVVSPPTSVLEYLKGEITSRRPQLDKYTFDVTLNQVIFSGARFFQVKSAEESYAAEREKLSEIKQKARLAVKTAFYDQLRTRYSIKNQEEIIRTLGENVVTAGLLYRGGKTSQVDLLRIQTQMASYEDEIGNSKNLAHTKALLLGQAMGTDAPVYARDDLRLPDDALPVKDACLRVKYKNHPEITAARWLQKKAEYDEVTSYGGVMPYISLRASYFHEDTKFFPGVPNWYAGIVATMPIFHGGTVVADIKQSRAKLEQAKETVKKIELGIIIRFQAARATLVDKSNRIKTTQKTLNLAREAYTAAELKYRAGRLGTMELLDAQMSWSNAYLGHINTIIDYHVARAELEYLCQEATTEE